MKISDYRVGTSFEIRCTKQFSKHYNKWYYENFEIIPRLASMWGRKESDVIIVKATVIKEDIIIKDLYQDKSYDNNKITYFGWVDFEDELSIHMIYPNIYQYSICFPYGPDSQRFWQYNDDTKNIKAGDRRGMTVILKIEEI